MFSLSIKIKNDELVLHGAEVQAPLRGCHRRVPGQLANGHSLEKIELVIEGQPGQWRPLVARLQSFLERMRLGQNAVLQLTADSRSEAYESRLYSGNFTWMAGSLQPKGIGLLLELERDDFWELPLRSIPLSNRYGSQVVDGLRVDNRLDALGENHVFWPADAVIGDMPAALQIRLTNDRQEGLEIDSLYLGSSRACYQDLPVLEGEAAASSENFSVIADSSCNGAACGRVQWSSSEELELFSWQIAGEQLVSFAGTVLRPLLRFPDANSYPPDIWLRWVIRQGATVYQSAASPVQPGAAFQILPDIRMPALPYGYEVAADVQVLLFGRSLVDDPAMTLDAVFLMGLDGWQHLEPLEGGLFAYGSAMVADSSLDFPLLVALDNQSSKRVYRFNGHGIRTTPLEAQAIQVAAVRNGSMPLDAALHVQVSYRPRVRVLI